MWRSALRTSRSSRSGPDYGLARCAAGYLRRGHSLLVDGVARRRFALLARGGELRDRKDQAVTTAAQWFEGARPRTLGAAVSPVLVGTAAAVADADGVIWWRFAAALVVALALQVGVNYANDYSDGVRGTDRERKGPLRLTATGTATPQAVRNAAALAFGVAAVIGLVLSLVVDPWLLVVGVAAIAAAVLYTGGPVPLGYLGLGELMVLVFFGFVATVGSAYVQVEYVPGAAWWGSLVVGLLACAILLANNVRDVPTDTVAGK